MTNYKGGTNDIESTTTHSSLEYQGGALRAPKDDSGPQAIP